MVNVSTELLLIKDLLKVLGLKVNGSKVAPEGDFSGVQPNRRLVVTNRLHEWRTTSEILYTRF